MDLIDVREIREPRSRADLHLSSTDRPLGGGTWLYSEPQPTTHALVDLTALDWPSLTVTDAGLEIAATCTIATLLSCAAAPEWTAWPLVAQCADSLLASSAIWTVATVGGNVALALPAGAMTTLLVTLDASALIWSSSGERRTPVSSLVTGNHENSLAPDELIRSFTIPSGALRARTGFRRISLAPLGRTGALVTARIERDGGWVVAVTGGCVRPHVVRFGATPVEAELVAAVSRAEWFDDAHGSADWRKAMSEAFAVQLLEELSCA